MVKKVIICEKCKKKFEYEPAPTGGALRKYCEKCCYYVEKEKKWINLNKKKYLKHAALYKWIKEHKNELKHTPLIEKSKDTPVEGGIQASEKPLQ